MTGLLAIVEATWKDATNQVASGEQRGPLLLASVVWPLILAIVTDHCYRPWLPTIATDQCYGPLLLTMVTDHGQWPLLVAIVTDRCQWPLILTVVTDHLLFTIAINHCSRNGHGQGGQGLWAATARLVDRWRFPVCCVIVCLHNLPPTGAINVGATCSFPLHVFGLELQLSVLPWCSTLVHGLHLDPPPSRAPWGN